MQSFVPAEREREPQTDIGVPVVDTDGYTTRTELTDRMLVFSERQLGHLLDTVLVFRPPSGP